MHLEIRIELGNDAFHDSLPDELDQCLDQVSRGVRDSDGHLSLMAGKIRDSNGAGVGHWLVVE